MNSNSPVEIIQENYCKEYRRSFLREKKIDRKYALPSRCAQ